MAIEEERPLQVVLACRDYDTTVPSACEHSLRLLRLLSLSLAMEIEIDQRGIIINTIMLALLGGVAIYMKQCTSTLCQECRSVKLGGYDCSTVYNVKSSLPFHFSKHPWNLLSRSGRNHIQGIVFLDMLYLLRAEPG